jgi:flagellar biogenesis protein FliO
MGPEPSLSAALRVTLTRLYGVLGGVLVVIVAMFWLALRRMLRRRPAAGSA